MSTGLPDLLGGALRVVVAVPLLATLGAGAIAHAQYEYDEPARAVTGRTTPDVQLRPRSPTCENGMNCPSGARHQRDNFVCRYSTQDGD